jgi:hypothetical protein
MYGKGHFYILINVKAPTLLHGTGNCMIYLNSQKKYHIITSRVWWATEHHFAEMFGNDESRSLHGSVVEDSILLRQDAMSIGNQTPISKTGTVIFTGLGVQDTASYPRTVESLVTRTF